MCNFQEFINVLISYNINQLVKPNAWDRKVYPISIFSTMKFLKIDSKNMSTSLLYMANFIRNRSIESNKVNNVNQLQDFGQIAYKFISFIYESDQDILTTNENNKTIKQNIVFKLSRKINNINPIKRTEQLKNKQVEVVKLSSPIPTKLLKKVLEKLKFFNKKGKKANKPEKPRKLYTQV